MSPAGVGFTAPLVLLTPPPQECSLPLPNKPPVLKFLSPSSILSKRRLSVDAAEVPRVPKPKVPPSWS